MQSGPNGFTGDFIDLLGPMTIGGEGGTLKIKKTVPVGVSKTVFDVTLKGVVSAPPSRPPGASYSRYVAQASASAWSVSKKRPTIGPAGKHVGAGGGIVQPSSWVSPRASSTTSSTGSPAR